MRVCGAPALLGLILYVLSPVAHAHSNGSSEMGFAADALISDPAKVDCTLETGLETECLQIWVKYKADGLQIGPFCPATIDTKGGIWNWTSEAPGLYRVDGAFLEMIAQQGYRMYGENGDVYISDIATARPEQDHTCIQVSEDETVQITALIPLHPVKADRPTRLGTVNKVGMALTGTPIFSDAPSVEHTGHMPALDPCGGHIDPGGWYHWHANANDIETVFHASNVVADCALHQDATQLFGYAFDGYPIFGSQDPAGEIPKDLDACNGHSGIMLNGEQGYHYHTSDTFPNLPKCLSGASAIGNFETTAQVGIGAKRPAGTEITPRNPPGAGGSGHERRGPPNLSEAANQLGVAEQDLQRALQRSGRPPDLALAAEDLGISEQELAEGLPRRRPR